MNWTKLTLSIIATCIVAGCGKRQPYDAQLLLAEQLMYEQYDSAFSIVYPMTDSTGVCEADRALLGLLYTEALHRKGLVIYDDTLVKASEAFFAQAGDDRHHAKSLLHHGIVLVHGNHLPEAVDCLKQAERIGKELKDDTLCCDVNEALGLLNKVARCKGLMKRHYGQALAYADRLNSDERRARSLRSLMQSCEQAGEADSAFCYMEPSLMLAKRLPPSLRAELLGCVGSLMLHRGDTAAGQRLLQTAVEMYPVDHATMRLGDVMAAKGNLQKAANLWFEALNTDNDEVQIAAYRRLIEYYKPREEWRALDLSTRLNQIFQRIQFTDKAEHLAELQADYDHQEMQRHVRQRVLFLILAVVVLLIVLLVFVIDHRRRALRYSEVVARIAELQRQLEKKAQQQSSAADQVAIQMLMDDDTVHRFHQMAKRGQAAQHDDWKQLHALVRQHDADFFTVINQNGLLSERDTHFCVLIKLHFQPTEIATLIGISPQIVTNSRTRLLSKIFGIKGGARDFDERIRIV